MPVISRFYGIVIMMFFKEHNPPHFHAKYEGRIAVFDICSRKILAGELPPQARKLIQVWAKQHEEELLEDWDRAQNDKSLVPIQPLE